MMNESVTAVKLSPCPLPCMSLYQVHQDESSVAQGAERLPRATPAVRMTRARRTSPEMILISSLDDC